MTNTSPTHQNLERIKIRFIAKLESWLPEIEAIYSKLCNSNEHLESIIKIEELEALQLKMHTIAGTAETFGFPNLTHLAGNVEMYLDLTFKDQQLKKSLGPLKVSLPNFIDEANTLILTCNNS